MPQIIEHCDVGKKTRWGITSVSFGLRYNFPELPHTTGKDTGVWQTPTSK